MGLAKDLQYEYGPRNWFHRSVGAFFTTRLGALIGRRVVPLADRAVLRLTGGAATISDWLAALPPLWLVSVGAKSGRIRRKALYGIPADDHLAVIGSSFGQSRTPGWVYNLEANSEAIVEYRKRSVRVIARPATADEETAIWATAASIHSGYAEYRKRASHRDIRVFVLEPLPSTE